MLRRDASRVGHPLRAPQIEAPGEALSDPFAEPEPRGFGPVPPFWAWRTRHLGTRDEAWQRERCPRMPEDLDYTTSVGSLRDADVGFAQAPRGLVTRHPGLIGRMPYYSFFQCAHPDLVVPRLRGDEHVSLDGLVPGGGSLGFALPGAALVSHHEWRDGRRVAARMALDGVHIDSRAPEGSWRVALTWRGWIARCPAYEGARLAVATPAETGGLPVSGEAGLEEP